MALEFERGMAALVPSSSGGGSSRRFTPFIKWEDGEAKYISILNSLDEIPRIFVHEYIKVDEGERQDGSTYPIFAEFLDRSAPPINEDADSLSEKGSQSRERNIAVAVELEPLMGTSRGGRNRPTGFEVKTTEFTRRIFDDDGNDTGKTETVTAPVIGFVMLSASNFFGGLRSFNEDYGPHDDVAFRVKRVGDDKTTQYHWEPFHDQEVDLANVLDGIDGISYIRKDLDEIIAEITEKELDDQAAAHLIASLMLEARLNELADPERYNELTADITEVKSTFGGGKGKQTNRSRGARKSQSTRKSKDEEQTAEPETDAKAEAETEESDDSGDSGDSDPSENDQLVAFKKLRAKSNRNKSDD